MILELHRQGVTVSAIARRVGLDRKTVRRYIARGLEPPVYGPRKPRTTQLQQFERYLRERIAGSKDPRRFGHALTSDRKGLWRYRVGDYRIIAAIEDDHFVVLVVAVGHRREVYR